jgi:hypothetical protein
MQSLEPLFCETCQSVLNAETIGQTSVYFFGSKPKTFAQQKAILF